MQSPENNKSGGIEVSIDKDLQALEEMEKGLEKPKSKKKSKVQLLTTKEVAAKVGVTPKALRRVLRDNWYNDGIHTNYVWKGWNDPMVKKILKFYNEKKTKTTSAPKVTKPAPKKTKTKATAKAPAKKMTQAEVEAHNEALALHKEAHAKAKAKLEGK